MPRRIPADVLEASALSIQGPPEARRPGEDAVRVQILAAEQRAAVRQQAIGQIAARHAGGEVISTVPLTASTLKERAGFVLDATLEDDTLSLRIDGLKKVDGP